MSTSSPSSSRFAKSATNVLLDADTFAVRHGFAQVEPVHLLWASIARETIAVNALRVIHCNPTTLAVECMHASLKAGSVRSNSTLTGRRYSDTARKVIEYGLRSALEIGNFYVGAEHVLLGCLKVESYGLDLPISQVLTLHPIDNPALKSAIIELQLMSTDLRNGQQKIRFVV